MVGAQKLNPASLQPLGRAQMAPSCPGALGEGVTWVVKAVNSHRTHEYYRRKDVVLKFFNLFFTILKNFIEI